MHSSMQTSSLRCNRTTLLGVLPDVWVGLLSQRPQTFPPMCPLWERERISFYQERQEALFDWLSGITRLSQYWSALPKGMWHHYEAWPYHLQPCSVWAGPGQNLMPPAPKVGTWRVTGRLVRVLFVFLTSWWTPKAWNQLQPEVAASAGPE